MAILFVMASYQHISHGFEPVFDENSRVLVLGSFPSVMSRANDFYYGNPANRFWRVLAACLGQTSPADDDIAAKRELLLAHGIALWDAIEECDIKGSSDASIKNVVPARVDRIFEAADVRAVLCNGATSGRLYKRYLQWKTGIEAVVLPSTSPANAAWSEERLRERWGEQLGTAFRAIAAGEFAESPLRTSHAAMRTEYAAVELPPKASSYAVHKSMQGNKRKDTKPELLVRQRLRETGLGGYRLQWKVPGRPDVAWPGKKVALFVNGCFWHRCPHCNPSTPKKNVEYWEAKFARNVERDERNLAELERAGWKVHVVWECQLKKAVREDTLARLLPQIAADLGKQLR